MLEILHGSLLDDSIGYSKSIKNSRQEELRSRYENLNEEEKAELMGLNVFPNNPRGAELRKKEALGVMSDEEKEELRKLYQLQDRAKNMSPFVKSLWERAEASDPNIEQVDMNTGKSIEVSSSDDKEKTIWTFGLGGCNCVVVFTEQEDGSRDCVLTHYDPTQLSVNMGKLSELISRSEKMRTAKSRMAVLATPGTLQIDPVTKKYVMKAHDQHAVDMLSLTIRAELGENVVIKLEPYSENQSYGTKDQGTLSVRIPPSGKGDAQYQTWFSGGTLSEQK